ncbi:MAG: hypothetical protein AAF356_05470 [Planctomycetota bacterium]
MNLISLIMLSASMLLGLLSAQPVPEPADTGDVFTDPDALLAAVAERDRRTPVLSADVRHVTLQSLAGDTQTREGRLILATDWTDLGPSGDPARRFSVKFDRLIVDERVRDERREYTFDGIWLTERIPEDRQFNKWQLTPPGERLDPFARMAGAPFWVPVGQDPARVRAVAEPEVLETTDWLEGEPMPAGLARHVEGAVQLRLTPREGTGFDDDWAEIRIWFERERLIPILYAAIEPTGDQQIAILTGASTDAIINPAVFDTATPGADEGWDVVIQTYRGD